MRPWNNLEHITNWNWLLRLWFLDLHLPITLKKPFTFCSVRSCLTLSWPFNDDGKSETSKFWLNWKFVNFVLTTVVGLGHGLWGSYKYCELALEYFLFLSIYHSSKMWLNISSTLQQPPKVYFKHNWGYHLSRTQDVASNSIQRSTSSFQIDGQLFRSNNENVND